MISFISFICSSSFAIQSCLETIGNAFLSFNNSYFHFKSILILDISFFSYFFFSFAGVSHEFAIAIDLNLKSDQKRLTFGETSMSKG